MSTLTYEVDETRNNAQKDNRIHDILSIPLETVSKILLNTIVFLNPDILVNSSFTKVTAVYRRNFGETAVHKNIWIEEHNGIKEDLTNRFQWNGENIMNSIIFLGIVPGFIYLVGKSAHNVSFFLVEA